MSRCDRCSRDFDYPGLFTVHHGDKRNPQWAALFCSEECRDSFAEKYRDRADVALEVLSLHLVEDAPESLEDEAGEYSDLEAAR